MPRINDAASLAALDSPMGAGMPPMDPAMMGAAPPEAPGGDIEGAIATLEAATAGAPPDKAEELRAHINAIREITSSMGAESAPPPEEESPNPDEVPQPPEVS